MTKIGPIAYLTGEYPRASDTFIQREIAGLRALGIEVETCSIRRTDPSHHVGPEQRQEAANTFHVLDASKNPVSLLRAHARLVAKRPKSYFSALVQAWRTRAPGVKAGIYQLIYFAEAGMLASHMQARGITHLHNHIATASCTVAMLASRLSGIPYSFTLHGPDIFFEPHRWRLDEKIASARFVACISHFCRAQAMNFSASEHWRKLHIIHCGVAPERYTSPARPRAKNLLFVGRLAGVKGVPVLMDALQALRAEHPDMRITFIGDGPERASLQARAVDMGLGDITDFVGYKGQSEVAAALAETDIFVLPSFAEGVPVVLMEAMAAKVPVVTTHVAGVPELVEDGVHGYLTHAGDSQSLQSAINALFNDPAKASEMGEAGRKKVIKEFNIESEAARLAGLFEVYKAPNPEIPVRREP